MSESGQYRRKNHFIKKGFQLHFSARFVLLIIIEAVLLAGVFWYLSQNTLTTSYQGAQLRIENTSSFFFPSMLYAVTGIVAVVGVIALAGIIYISHKIAGPLYRFEESLKEIGKGNIGYRFNLRKNDQLSDLAGNLNSFMGAFERRVGETKSAAADARALVERLKARSEAENNTEAEALILELETKLETLHHTLDYYISSSGDGEK